MRKSGAIRTTQSKIPITTNTYVHLKDLRINMELHGINDHEPTSELPVHVILGISDYTKIKTQERPRVGLPEEPIAELTKFGWIIVSPGQETGVTNMLFSKISLHDYENFCRLDCLGIEERHDDSNYVYEEFRKQLGCGPGRFYQTNLIWKEKPPPLKSNKPNSFGRLSSLGKT